MAKQNTRRYTRTAAHAVFTSDGRSSTYGKVEHVYVGQMGGGNVNVGTVVNSGFRSWIAFAKGDVDAEQSPQVASGFTNRAAAADAAVAMTYGRPVAAGAK